MTILPFDPPVMSASEQAFWRYHEANPVVYDTFLHYARQAKLAGRGKLGINSLIERVRWHHTVDIRRTDDFKINNNHGPYYARLIMKQHPAFVDFFETRASRADDSSCV